MDELTTEIVKEFLDYNKETGELYWLPRARSWFKTERQFGTWNGRYAGKAAGRICVNGYRQVRVFGRGYTAHRLAWVSVYGVWPVGQLDHINGDRADNRIGNLREATPSENNRNLGRSARNTSGFTGVTFHKQTKKWQAQIWVGGRQRFLGLFDAPEEAHTAYAVVAEANGYTLRHIHNHAAQ